MLIEYGASFLFVSAGAPLSYFLPQSQSTDTDFQENAYERRFHRHDPEPEAVRDPSPVRSCDRSRLRARICPGA
ncbi:hypothetical protein CBM2586_B130317 [Cupriavidus phytorum]|uniref:Uncharacterized protein n=1 Tax=Cupriavidus taiwanensis TaxID=164546 RepID=A0A375CIX0_9BURK|nr:hypothetical protein CBM2586_B130317 [Cupriavidus taiwanensis]